MTAADFAKWLEALLAGPADRRALMAVPEIVSRDLMARPDGLHPCVTAFFPSGAFVLTVEAIGPREAPAARNDPPSSYPSCL